MSKQISRVSRKKARHQGNKRSKVRRSEVNRHKSRTKRDTRLTQNTEPPISENSSMISKVVFLTENERAVCEALATYGNYNDAARVLMKKVQTLRTMTFRIRMRYDRALKFAESIREFQKRITKIDRTKRYLTG